MIAHVVALSGGKDSTAMALRLRELYPDLPFVFVCTPTGDELPPMFAHWRKCSDLLGSKIVPIVHPRQLAGIVEDEQAIPNWRMRFCTRMLKIEPFAAYLAALQAKGYAVHSYVGIRADEPEREAGDYTAIPGVESVFPLRDWGWELADVLAYNAARGVEIPKRTDCARCFYQRLDEWYALWNDWPEVYADAEAQELRMGYTWRSPGRDTQPAALVDLRAKFEAGYVPKVRAGTAVLQCRVCRL